MAVDFGLDRESDGSDHCAGDDPCSVARPVSGAIGTTLTSLRRPEAVLFDLDGTLVDSIELIVRTWQSTVEEHLGIVHTREEVIPRIGRSLERLFDELDPSMTKRMASSYRERMAAWHDDWIQGYPGVDGLLSDLATAGARIGLVTSKSRASAQISLRFFDLERWMETIVTSDRTDRHKPDPAPLLLAASDLGLDPGACWYVGDSVHDLSAARGAGMVAVAALWGPSAREVLEPLADWVAAAPSDVLQLWEDSVSG